MNLFVLDSDPIAAAKFCYDVHCVKMPLEGMQMLCTNTRLLLGEEATQHEMMSTQLMRATHANHPSTIWGRTSSHNFAWMLANTEALFREYTRRYGKTHASEQRLYALMPLFEQCMEKLESWGNIEQTPFALAMPDACKLACPVASYRKLYAHKAQQEIDKVVVYNVLVRRGCSPRKPALRFVWNKATRPEWATFKTADCLL